MADPENFPASSFGGRKQPPPERRVLIQTSTRASMAMAVEWLLRERRGWPRKAVAWDGDGTESKVLLALKFNGKVHTLRVDPASTLFAMLHEQLGCDASQVWVDGHCVDPRHLRAILCNGSEVQITPTSEQSIPVP